MAYFVVNEKCNGCLACVENCPATALDVRDEGHRRTLLHNMARCARCATCWRVCPQGAIEFQHLLANRWDSVVTLDLVCCEVCGEPLHTTCLGDTLPERLTPFPGARCPAHRSRMAAADRIVPRGAQTPPDQGGKTG